MTMQSAGSAQTECWYAYVQDPEVPVYLLRNVCYFCDSNGIQALAICFRDSDPEILPCHIAHVLITICANVSACAV